MSLQIRNELFYDWLNILKMLISSHSSFKKKNLCFYSNISSIYQNYFENKNLIQIFNKIQKVRIFKLKTLLY